MKTEYYELDKIIELNNSQLIVCSSADKIIETFLCNILKNISVDQAIPVLYIDNNITRDCVNSIKKEREVLFENKKYEIQTMYELMRN